MHRATTRIRLALFALLMLMSLSVVGIRPSLAAKPGGGGGGSGGTGGGTIYYITGSSGGYVINAMNSDGTGKTTLPLNETGTPSRLLHGGQLRQRGGALRADRGERAQAAAADVG